MASGLCQFRSAIIESAKILIINTPQNTTVVHYIDNITGSDEQQVTSTLIALIRHMQTRKWEISPTKDSVKFLEMQWPRV